MANVTNPSQISLSSATGAIAPLNSIVSFLRNIFGAIGSAGVAPIGSILPYGGTTAPTGWLLCDGTSYSRTTYSALFAVIGTAYGTADSTHFNVPLLCGATGGYFIRGADTSAGQDPDRAARTALQAGGNTGAKVGSAQADAMQGHHHYLLGVGANNTDSVPDSGVAGAPDTAITKGNPAGGTVSIGAPYPDGSHGTPRVSSETRPQNVNVNFIIKA